MTPLTRALPLLYGRASLPRVCSRPRVAFYLRDSVDGIVKAIGEAQV